jgi:hypothetical protein
MGKDLYEKDGTAVAYLEDGEVQAVLLNENGKTVAFLDGDGLHGWNGDHLGWFVGGIVYDRSGRRVGYTEQTCPATVQEDVERPSEAGRAKRYPHYPPPPRPKLRSDSSGKTLLELLKEGSID